ncbi:LysR family transcriptional regulator [Roseibium sp. MMSF_3544]|uniref:LysR family transcriptional regulator n=1 Tax=unclassified Roseibium TaxID=2629323 RepID=UPI00273D3BF1|nr:LysR family transcriptional regulator [Roseibium sp. MMSF_3544]
MQGLNWKLLTAFEAAARHRNFTRAAQELNVQQPAISRRVAALENQLGTRLLLRSRPRATLTPEGEILFRAISGGIFQVGNAIEQVRARPEQHVVTVNTTIGFASCYLMKRLPVFRAANSDVSIELVSRDQNDAYASEASDIVIVFDHPERLPGTHHKRIFSETLVAAARPDVAAGAGGEPEDLMQQNLLHLTMGIHRNDWQTFLAGTGLTPAHPSSGSKFTSFTVYLQAALNGDGVMLGWETLLDDQFELGLLTPVTERRVSTDRGYFACLTARAQSNPSAASVFEWLGQLEQ